MGAVDVLSRGLPGFLTPLPGLEAPTSARRAPRCHLWSQEWQKGNTSFPLAPAGPERRWTAPQPAAAERSKGGALLPPLVGGHLPPVGLPPTPPKEPKERRRDHSRPVTEGRVQLGVRDHSRPVTEGRGQLGVRATTAEAPRSQARRSSQSQFAHPRQTVIILDWDDTLFPTSHVRERQGSPDRARLARAAAAVEQLLRRAAALGEVRIVTLAKAPWVSVSCEHFFPGLRALLDQLGIKVVYAASDQDGSEIDYGKVNSMSDAEADRLLSGAKGRAIAREVREFYSDYEGQTWKNVISIGDSVFERSGTHGAVRDYMDAHGLLGKDTNARGEVEANGHVFKIRTKTLKLKEHPTIDELTTQVTELQRWLPQIVHLDASFDLELSDRGGSAEVQAAPGSKSSSCRVSSPL